MRSCCPFVVSFAKFHESAHDLLATDTPDKSPTSGQQVGDLPAERLLHKEVSGSGIWSRGIWPVDAADRIRTDVGRGIVVHDGVGTATLLAQFGVSRQADVLLDGHGQGEVSQRTAARRPHQTVLAV